MNYKIICTGNTVAPSITHYLNKLYPDIKFISRTSGYDLTTQEGLIKFKEILPNYNIFINHSQPEFGVQQTLLKYARECWTHGHVINIGSILEFEKWGWYDIPSSLDKKELRDLSLSLSSEHFKTTHIMISGLKSDKHCVINRLVNKDFILEPEKVANMIKFIIECECYIPLLCVDNINDELEKKWLSLRSDRT